MPRITIIGYDEDDRPEPPAPPGTPMEDDPMDAEKLCNRLIALKGALDDLPRQARRMLRLKARDPNDFVFKHPMRPGFRSCGNATKSRVGRGSGSTRGSIPAFFVA